MACNLNLLKVAIVIVAGDDVQRLDNINQTEQ